MSVGTVVFGGATHNESGSGPTKLVETEIPGEKFTMVEL